MNKKLRITIIIAAAGLLLAAGVVYLLFFYYQFSAVTEQSAAQKTKPSPEQPSAGQTSVQPVSPLKTVEVKREDLIKMAAAFAERLGSFSNQSDCGNIRDLQIFMTAAMKAWAQKSVCEARAEQSNTTDYYGIITKSIYSEAKQFDGSAGQAEILVKTQRREQAKAAGGGAAFYQDITIKYLREGGVWLVDGAYWQEK
ncbi:MAG: hypothetical protein PHS62_04715 [Patescibacteria group bacterium]|nr:hypothetical protein [Patescibacteria group bacterium]